MDKNLRINFVSQGNSYLASHRMRVLQPVQLFNVGVKGILASITKKVDPMSHVNIFGKHFDTEGNLEAIYDINKSYKTVFDVCDNHFGRELDSYYRDMCTKADLVTCNTVKMAEKLKEEVGVNAFIIPDTITFFEDEYMPISNTPQFLWYGHDSNILPLIDWLPHIGGRVKVVSDSQVNHPNVDWTGWKPLVVETIVKNTDFVLVPTAKHEWVSCKSPNRAVDALWAGKIVITDSKEIYGDLEEFIFIIEKPEEIPDIITHVKENPDEISKKILKGQEYIEKHYGNAVVVDGWLEVIKELGLIKDYVEA